jgi:outer membrane receptor protein involved in Fe transport
MSTRTVLRGLVFWLALANLTLARPEPAAADPGGADEVVTGRITDPTGNPIAGADIEMVELRRQVRTDDAGRFCITAVPSGRFTLRARRAFFGEASRVADVPLEAPIEMVLGTDLRFQEKVTVTAAPWASHPLEAAQQVDVVAGEGARRENVASVGEALAGVPGVAFIPTGNSLGTPVIRGLSEHRIRVMSDGVALNHQQNSWRHSPNVEPAFADRLELVQGPSTVLYGPDAMGGVINVVHAPLPFDADGHGVLHGEIAPSFSSNSGEWTGRGRIEGALGGLGFRIDALRREGRDITTPSGTLDNTDFTQTNAAVTAGYGASWGTARVRWHRWEDETGFFRPEGFRLDLSDNLFAADVHVSSRLGTFELLLARQQNLRSAFPAALGGKPGVDLDLITLTGRLGFEHRPLGVLRGHVAIEYTGLDNTPLAGQLVPEYQGDRFALMALEELRLARNASGDFDRVVLSLGLRWDTQSVDVVPFPAWQLGSSVTKDYSAVTGALGAVVRLGRDVAVAASLARGWRPPNAFELFARGEHDGVAAFQLGSPDLVEETNLNGEIGLRYDGRRIHGRLSGYRNEFGDYIYLADSGAVEGDLPVFVHRQGDARIEGLEAALEAEPLDWIRVGVGCALVDTRNKVTSRRLPQTPPDRLLASVRVQRERLGAFARASLGIGGTFVAKGVVSGPDEPLGTPTGAYQVFDLRGGLALPIRHAELRLDLTIRNLFDTEYTDFLWSYKPFAPNPGRDLRAVMHLQF